ncbi:DNA adenine methylase [Pantoea agglomerans]|uniref:DNA adenine methylase n=1 Tax=Enterobacter agglomerans TaxID=549 RepID=UPI0030EE1F40
MPHLPKSDCLIEPFVGGASVFMNTDYRRYVLGDINPHLINFYRVISSDTENFISTARSALFRDGNNEETYYSCLMIHARLRGRFQRGISHRRCVFSISTGTAITA